MKSLLSLLTRTVRKPTTTPPRPLTEVELEMVAGGGSKIGVATVMGGNPGGVVD